MEDEQREAMFNAWKRKHYAEEKEELKEITNQPLLIADAGRRIIPHRCPVCAGTGLVPNGFYMQNRDYYATSSTTPETCRSCNGTGIVWS